MANDPKLKKFKKNNNSFNFGYAVLILIVVSVVARFLINVLPNNNEIPTLESLQDRPVAQTQPVESTTVTPATTAFKVAAPSVPTLKKVSKKVVETSMQSLVADIAQKKVKSIEVRGQKVLILYTNGTKGSTYKESETSFTEQLVSLGATPEQLQSVPIAIKTNTGPGYLISLILPFLIPVIVILVVFYFITRQVKGGNSRTFDFGKTKARMSDPEKKQTTFDDVAGNIEAKNELAEIVDFLKFPKKYQDIGAKVPRGILLAGSPGTGKTLLARAVAGEAGVPFFHLSGSEFVEMFVGVGASRVRDLFDLAKKAAPAIVFIDEIDAVGRHRGVGMGGGNDEREQTLNQILVEMDGFEPTQAVIILAATNRPDVLDEALLRPGRFDRRVMLDMPDRKDRVEILKIYSTKKKMEEGIDFNLIATRTPGFSGADLESLMNEAAIKAARADRLVISQNDIMDSIEKVMMGPQRKSHLADSDERKLVAYHEAGHAVVASVLENSDPVHKVTIIPRGFAGGYTLKLPTDERKLQTRAHYIAELAVCLGGMAAEKIMFGDITPGASSDLQNATSIARAMVAKWGMSEKVGPIAIDSLTKNGGFGEVAVTASQSTFTLVDSEIRALLDDALETAHATINKYKPLLEKIAELLLEKETIEQDEFNELLTSFNIPLKKSNARELENDTAIN